jgi:hypothetical protein
LAADPSCLTCAIHIFWIWIDFRQRGRVAGRGAVDPQAHRACRLIGAACSARRDWPDRRGIHDIGSVPSVRTARHSLVQRGVPISVGSRSHASRIWSWSCAICDTSSRLRESVRRTRSEPQCLQRRDISLGLPKSSASSSRRSANRSAPSSVSSRCSCSSIATRGRADESALPGSLLRSCRPSS